MLVIVRKSAYANSVHMLGNQWTTVIYFWIRHDIHGKTLAHGEYQARKICHSSRMVRAGFRLSISRTFYTRTVLHGRNIAS